MLAAEAQFAASQAAETQDRTDSQRAGRQGVDSQTAQVRDRATQIAREQAVIEANTPAAPTAPPETDRAVSAAAIQSAAQNGTATAAADAGQQATNADEAGREATEKNAADADAVTEDDQAAQADNAPTESNAATSLRDLLAPAPQPAEPAASAPGDYDLAVAQAEVQQLTGDIQAAADTAEQNITTEADTAQNSISSAAGSAKKSVEKQVITMTDRLTSAIDIRRDQADNTFIGVSASIESEFEARDSETSLKGGTSKDNLSGSFRQHRSNIKTTVGDKVSEADRLTERHVNAVKTKTKSQSDEALRKGIVQLGEYDNTERGAVQKGAAYGVARETAKEIRKRQPDAVQAIREITAAIPAEFRQKEREALDGFDGGLPDLLTQVDNQVSAVVGQLQQHHEITQTQLQAAHTQVLTRFDSPHGSGIKK